jgi:hypothetical protein
LGTQVNAFLSLRILLSSFYVHAALIRHPEQK